MREAAGSVTGKTIASQIRQAARYLGYAPESWRVREAWYGRAGAWSAAAVDDLRQRHVMWLKPDGARVDTTAPSTLAQRVGNIRRCLADLERQVDELEAEIHRSPPLGADDG